MIEVMGIYLFLVLLFGFISTILISEKMKGMKWYGLIIFYLFQPLLIIREIFVKRKENGKH